METTRQPVRLDQLRTGQRFRFVHAPASWYAYRGNNWFDGGCGYEGGPWHRDGQTLVLAEDSLSDQWDSHLATRGGA